MKILAIVGNKNSGKTTLTVKIIEKLKNKGYNVASIKHTHHPSLEMDKEGTDTWKHKEAGSEIVVGSGTTAYFNIREDLPLERLLFLIKVIKEPDFVVLEGFKSYPYAKIATSKDVIDEYTIKDVNALEIDDNQLDEIITLAEEKAYDIVDTLYFNECGYSNGDEIAKDIVNDKIKTVELDKVDVNLSIDEKIIGLNEFVSSYIGNTIRGMAKSLKTNKKVEEEPIKILITRKSPSDSKTIITVSDEIININKFVSLHIENTVRGMLKTLKINPDTVKNQDKIEIVIK